MFTMLFNLLAGIAIVGGALYSGDLNWISFILACIGLNMLLAGFLAFMRQLGDLLEAIERKSP